MGGEADPMNTIYCGHCGQRTANLNFCAHCGGRIHLAQRDSDDPRKSPDARNFQGKLDGDENGRWRPVSRCIFCGGYILRDMQKPLGCPCHRTKVLVRCNSCGIGLGTDDAATVMDCPDCRGAKWPDSTPFLTSNNIIEVGRALPARGERKKPVARSLATTGCPRCGGTQFLPRRKTSTKVMFSILSVVAAPKHVECVACGAMWRRPN